MKKSKALALLISSAMAFTLAGGIAYAMEPDGSQIAPLPEVAQDTSITEQVASIVVYQDQEEAAAMVKEVETARKDFLAAAKDKHSPANDYPDAQSIEEIETAKAQRATEEAAAEAEEAESVEPESALEELSHEDATVETGLAPGSINVNGDTLDYIDSFKTASAPTHGAGLWMGSDSTTDDSWGYFIGHNPGDFTAVMTLKNGDPVTVCDRDGNTRTYHVIDEFIVPDTTYWEDIESRVTQYGESVILQTCCGDNAHYRVVIAD